MSSLVLRWWTRFPVKIRRFSKLLSEAWIDGVYLTAWPRAALAAPAGVFLFGLIEGASHWSLLTYSGGAVSAAFHAVDFVQMLPLLFIAVICGAMSSQLGMLLVLGFAFGDFFVAAPFGPLHWSAWDTASKLYAPELISYLAFFLLAVTPALTAKAMVASLPGWLRRPGVRSAWVAASLAVAVQGVSVYAWTLAAPMIVRVQWLWVGQQPPVSVVSFLSYVDPWLPMTAMAAMAFRLWFSMKARGKLDTSGIAAAGKEMQALDRRSSAGIVPAALGALGSAVVVIALISGLFDSIARGTWVFCVVVGLFLVRNLVLPKLPAWAWWSQFANRVPLVVRWAAAVVTAFFVTRLVVSNSAWSPAHNLTPGAFGVEIFCFLLSLAVALLLLPIPAHAGTPLRLSRTARAGAKAIAFICIFAFATRVAHADICLDPFCCFGGAAKIAALVVAAILLLALGWYLVSLLGLLEGAAFSLEEIEAAIASSRRLQGMISAGMRAIEKKLGHAGAKGFVSAFEGIFVSQESAEALIEQIMSNPAEINFLNKYIDVYNALGQGVRLNSFYEFVGFLEGILK